MPLFIQVICGTFPHNWSSSLFWSLLLCPRPPCSGGWVCTVTQASEHPASLPISSMAAVPPKQAVLHDCHCPVWNHIPTIREACKNYIFPFVWTFLIYFLYSYNHSPRVCQITSIMEEKELKGEMGAILHSDLASPWVLRTRTRSMDSGAGTVAWWVRAAFHWPSTRSSVSWPWPDMEQVTVPASWLPGMPLSLESHKQYFTGSLHEMHRASLLHTTCPAESRYILPLSPTGSGRSGSLGWKRTPRLPSSTSHLYFTSTLTRGSHQKEGRKTVLENRKRGGWERAPMLGVQWALGSTLPLSAQADWERTHWAGKRSNQITLTPLTILPGSVSTLFGIDYGISWARSK